VLSGYKFEVSTTKDLPIGYVRGQLDLALSKLGEGEADRTIALPVYAIVGQGHFTLQPDMLLFKKPDITEEDTARVNLTFNTPSPRESVTVKSVEPKFLTCDKPEKGLDGRWRITVHMPRNNAEAAKYQADPPMIGRVVLEVGGLERPVIVKVMWQPQPKPK